MKIGFYLFFLSLALCLSICNAYELKPYVGVDGQINRVKFKKGYGDNLFPKNYPQVNVYSGLKFKNNYSVEFGYIAAGLKSRYSVLRKGEGALGVPLPGIAEPAVFKSNLKIQGCHFSVINSFLKDSWDHFRILGGIGLAFLKAEACRESIEVGIPPMRVNSKRHFKKHKVVLRLMVAPEYKFKNSLGIRASVCFLNTSKITMKADPIQGIFTPVIRPKDSFVYSLGAFYEF